MTTGQVPVPTIPSNSSNSTLGWNTVILGVAAAATTALGLYFAYNRPGPSTHRTKTIKPDGTEETSIVATQPNSSLDLGKITAEQHSTIVAQPVKDTTIKTKDIVAKGESRVMIGDAANIIKPVKPNK